MDFQTDYGTLTKKIDDTLTTQVSSSLTWNNIPGNFDKVVSSSGGYAWGFKFMGSDMDLAICELPCTGNWKKVDLTSVTRYNAIRDIAIDNINVYVLLNKFGEDMILSNNVSGKGEWSKIYSSSDTGRIILSTNNFLWIQNQDNTNIKKCPKPCTGGNWLDQINSKDIILLSSTDTELYGKDVVNNVVKTDENMKTGWNVIKGFKDEAYNHNFVTVGTDPKRSGIYAITQGNVVKCKGDCTSPDDISPVDTKGISARGITYDSGSKNLWMTGWQSGEKGNVFSQLDKPDYTAIMKNVTPLDKQRDEIAEDIKKDYAQQTNTLITNKQIQAVVDFFSKQFGYTKSVQEQTKNETTALNQTIQSTQGEIDKKAMISDKLFRIIVTLVIVVFVYLVGETFIGIYIHLVVSLILIGGIIFTIYY